MVSPIPNSELKNLELGDQKGLGLHFFSGSIVKSYVFENKIRQKMCETSGFGIIKIRSNPEYKG